MGKGDYQTYKNNLVFDRMKEDDKQGGGCTMCVCEWVRGDGPMNLHSVTENNVADILNGGKNLHG